MPAALPSGTVTFLFTDIEGSTKLLQRLGDDYARVLGEHQALLRAAWAAHGRQDVDGVLSVDRTLHIETGRIPGVSCRPITEVQ